MEGPNFCIVSHQTSPATPGISPLTKNSSKELPHEVKTNFPLSPAPIFRDNGMLSPPRRETWSCSDTRDQARSPRKAINGRFYLKLAAFPAPGSRLQGLGYPRSVIPVDPGAFLARGDPLGGLKTRILEQFCPQALPGSSSALFENTNARLFRVVFFFF